MNTTSTWLRSLASIFSCVLAAAAVAQVQIICQLQPGADPALVGKRFGMQTIDTTSPAPFVLFRLNQDVDVERFLLALTRDPDVVWADDDKSVVMPEHTSASKGGTIAAIWDRNSWYAMNEGMLDQIGWSQSLASTPGRQVRFAVLDTGLSPRQRFLWRKVAATLNTVEVGQAPFDLPYGTDSNGNGFADEGVGHGTMIAGLVDQISPLTQLVIVRVADSDGNSSSWRIIKGLAFAVINGAEVANVSLGSDINIPALSDAMDWVEAHNMLVVAPGGNNGLEMVTAPARITKVVAVGGLDPDDFKAPFSNWDGKIDTSAPATGIKSTYWDGSLGIWSGTSFASPMMAASLADALRRIAPQPLDILRTAAEDSGDDLDGLNPEYSGKLGTALNFTRLSQWLGAG